MLKYLFSFVAVFALVATAAEARMTRSIDNDKTLNYGYTGDLFAKQSVNCAGSNEHFDAYMTENEVNFDFDRSKLNRGEMGRHTVKAVSKRGAHYNKVALDRQAAYMKKHPHTDLFVIGHTDIRGSHKYNDGLGERRAMAVKKGLMKRGVDGSRIHAVSAGEHEVKYNNHPDNRRVKSQLQD